MKTKKIELKERKRHKEAKLEQQFKFDCFLAHSWGKEHETHKTVMNIAISLKESGLKV